MDSGNVNSWISRRALLQVAGATLVAPASAWADRLKTESAANESSDGCSLGFSTYGMPSMPTEDAINTLAEIGYDSVELAVRKGWDADSEMLKRDRRQTIQRQLGDSGIRLTSLMEHVFPGDDAEQANALARLQLAAEVAHDLSPDSPPVIQTVLGGGVFAESKARLKHNLEAWVRLADAADVVIAIKPHRGGVVSQPSEAVWLIEQLGSPKSLRMVYDYSHYAYRDLSIADTVQTALPYVAHVAVKDATKAGQRVVFELPGETGQIDFLDIIRRLHQGGYRGDINCEVSGMVSKQRGYDAIAAARTCYQNMSMAFETSGIPRSS